MQIKIIKIIIYIIFFCCLFSGNCISDSFYLYKNIDIIKPKKGESGKVVTKCYLTNNNKLNDEHCYKINKQKSNENVNFLRNYFYRLFKVEQDKSLKTVIDHKMIVNIKNKTDLPYKIEFSYVNNNIKCSVHGESVSIKINNESFTPVITVFANSNAGSIHKYFFNETAIMPASKDNYSICYDNQCNTVQKQKKSGRMFFSCDSSLQGKNDVILKINSYSYDCIITHKSIKYSKKPFYFFNCSGENLGVQRKNNNEIIEPIIQRLNKSNKTKGYYFYYFQQINSDSIYFFQTFEDLETKKIKSGLPKNDLEYCKEIINTIFAIFGEKFTRKYTIYSFFGRNYRDTLIKYSQNNKAPNIDLEIKQYDD